MLLCAGIGIWIGRYQVPTPPAPAAPPATTAILTNKSGLGTAVAVAPAPVASGSESNAVKKLSWDDVPAAMAAALAQPAGKRSDAFSEIVDSVDSADLPKLMALFQKDPGIQSKPGLPQELRDLVLTRWAGPTRRGQSRLPTASL